MPEFNMDQTSLMLLGGGAFAMISSTITKKEPFATLGIIGGGIIMALGALNATGTLQPLLQQFGVSKSNYVGAYAVDLRNLPYDPNNYYLPPRDTSILP